MQRQSSGVLAAFASVTTLFFAWGFITSNNDPLIAALRAVFRLSYAEALRAPWALFGAVAIFLYVGAEVSIGSIMINFLNRPDVLGISLEAAGVMLANYYWGGALVGRFVGSALLTRLPAARLLTGAATIAALLCLTVAFTDGPTAAYAALAVGFFNSIMFPTIFTLTLERSGVSEASTSGLLCLAIVGGAFLPLLTGAIADAGSLMAAFTVPLVAYVVIAFFAFRALGARLTHMPDEENEFVSPH